MHVVTAGAIPITWYTSYPPPSPQLLPDAAMLPVATQSQSPLSPSHRSPTESDACAQPSPELSATSAACSGHSQLSIRRTQKGPHTMQLYGALGGGDGGGGDGGGGEGGGDGGGEGDGYVSAPKVSSHLRNLAWLNSADLVFWKRPVRERGVGVGVVGWWGW